jgi:hypothetical protein
MVSRLCIVELLGRSANKTYRIDGEFESPNKFHNIEIFNRSGQSEISTRQAVTPSMIRLI